MCSEQADTVRGFLAATAKGYQFAAENPQQAAALLCKTVTNIELDPGLVKDSMQMLAKVRFHNMHVWLGKSTAFQLLTFDTWNLTHDALKLHSLTQIHCCHVLSCCMSLHASAPMQKVCRGFEEGSLLSHGLNVSSFVCNIMSSAVESKQTLY